MPFVMRDESGKVVGSFLNSFPGAEEWLEEDDPENPFQSPDLADLANLKAQVKLQVRQYAMSLLDQVIQPVSPGEAASWSYKEAEARAYQASGDPADAPYIQHEAAVRGVSLTEFAQIVLGKSNALKIIQAQVVGNRGRHENAIDQLTTVQAVLNYDWLDGWQLPTG